MEFIYILLAVLGGLGLTFLVIFLIEIFKNLKNNKKKENKPKKENDLYNSSNKEEDFLIYLKKIIENEINMRKEDDRRK